jgi:hypothetical protein
MYIGALSKGHSLIDRLLIVVLLTGAMAVAVAGCGDDTSADSSGEASLTKAGFVKQADRICQSSRTRILQSEDSGRPDMSEAEIVSSTIEDAWLPVLQDMVDRVRDLRAPEGDERKVEELLDAMQDAIDTAEGQQIPSLARFEQIFAPSGSMARNYGVSGCAFG